MTKQPSRRGVDETGTPGLHHFERNRFFSGKLMTARDMLAEQRYHSDRLNTYARYLTGSGIVCGLETAVEGGGSNDLTATVEPGLALDCSGRLLVVECRTSVELESPSEGPLHLYLHYDECVSESVGTPGSKSSCGTDCEYNRVLETFEVRSGEEPSDGHKGVSLVEYPDPDDFDADDPHELGPLFRMARSYYEFTESEIEEGDVPESTEVGQLEPCPTCEQEGVFLGTFVEGEGQWERDTAVQRRFAYTAEMLHAAIARHVADFENPHWVALGVEDDDDGARLLVKGQNDEDGTVSLQPSGGVTITPNGDEVEIGVDVDTEALEDDIRALIRYVLYRSLCHKRVAFSVVAETFINTEVGELSRDISEKVAESIEDGLAEDPEAYAEFVGDIVDMEQDVADLLEEYDTATDASLERYRQSLDGLSGALEREAPLAIAAAQDCVAEAASWLRPEEQREETRLTCLTFDDYGPDDDFEDSIEAEGFRIEPEDSARFTEIGDLEERVALMFREDGLIIDLPASSYVEVEVYTGAGPTTLLAYNSAGSVVAAEESPDTQQLEASFTFTISARDVDRLRLYEGGGEGMLLQLCRV